MNGAPLTAQMKGPATVGKLSRLLLSRQQVNRSSSSRASVNFNTTQAQLHGKSCEALREELPSMVDLKPALMVNVWILV